jgi:hypothetical protein
MIRKLGIGAGVFGALLITATVALAAVTFHSGPTVTFSGATATATFNVSGLGNDPAFAFLNVNGFATYECRTKGGNAAPGQNPVPASGSSGPVQLNNSQKNGRDDVTVSATLTSPPTPSPEDQCPNGNWRVVQTGLTVTSATLRIEQPLGNIIYGPATFTP